jgi:hypothetical protein
MDAKRKAEFEQMDGPQLDQELIRYLSEEIRPEDVKPQKGPLTKWDDMFKQIIGGFGNQNYQAKHLIKGFKVELEKALRLDEVVSALLTCYEGKKIKYPKLGDKDQKFEEFLIKVWVFNVLMRRAPIYFWCGFQDYANLSLDRQTCISHFGGHFKTEHEGFFDGAQETLFCRWLEKWVFGHTTFYWHGEPPQKPFVTGFKIITKSFEGKTHEEKDPQRKVAFKLEKGTISGFGGEGEIVTGFSTLPDTGNKPALVYLTLIERGAGTVIAGQTFEEGPWGPGIEVYAGGADSDKHRTVVYPVHGRNQGEKAQVVYLRLPDCFEAPPVPWAPPATVEVLNNKVLPEECVVDPFQQNRWKISLD